MPVTAPAAADHGPPAWGGGPRLTVAPPAAAAALPQAALRLAQAGLHAAVTVGAAMMPGTVTGLRARGQALALTECGH